MSKKIRPIAIHLPQFHPIPENDAWWGKGFTEWRNVVQAKPRFKGHYQPHIPADLGFYDLRLPEVRQQQTDLAKEYGIYGFCYYHYWFNGRQVLERPVKEILESGEPNFPFMLCWANENWTKIWDGGDTDLLLEQHYTDEDCVRHVEFLIPFFKDSRYIKIDGKPVFIIYKDALIPNLSNMIKIFREVAKSHGLEIYLCRFERDIGTLDASATSLGFDAGIEFQPLSKSFSKFKLNSSIRSYLFAKFKHRIKSIYQLVNQSYVFKLLAKSGSIDFKYNYAKFIDFDISQGHKDPKVYPCVSPSWDNSSRRVNNSATIFEGSTPDLFEYWIKNKIDNFTPPSLEENFIFINAWNEWAEGNHLEPCMKYGHGYLKALKNVIDSLV